jgi:DNA polymerase-1
VSDDERERQRFLEYASHVKTWIGHNVLEYDIPILNRLIGFPFPDTDHVLDTLILSRLINYSRKGGHSIEQYGIEFGLEKGKFNDFSKYSEELEFYCCRDVDIGERVYRSYLRCISDPVWQRAIHLEHRFQLVVNDLHTNGFCFDLDRANNLLKKVTSELEELDGRILEAFPPRSVAVRTFVPKATKFGTISKTSVPRSLWDKIADFEVGKPYTQYRTEDFNPSSHKQLVTVLAEAGWKPEEKTQTHIDFLREKNPDKVKLEHLKKYGWKVNETNLGTLPQSAPEGARLLAKRILLEARRRSLTEWVSLVNEDGRIHGKFVGIGAWTHRMAHQQPNTANIPRELKEDGSPKLLGREMRELWCAPRNKLLVGVDAEGIQLRVFAHYIDDPEFTEALVKGKKDDKTDPHSLNQRVLGSHCKTRQAAKRFIYALLLGGGITKLAFILGCSEADAREALDRVLRKYTGFATLKKEVFPKDGRRGYFIGLDGRKIPIPGETQRDREHLAMSGYLQAGEAIVIKRAAILIDDVLKDDKAAGKWKFINIVHDELQSEVGKDWHYAERVAKVCADAIVQAGETYGLKCPMAGSYWNDDNKKLTIGKNWYVTH